VLFPQSDPTNANWRTAMRDTAEARRQNRRRIFAALSDVTQFQLVNTDVWKALRTFFRNAGNCLTDDAVQQSNKFWVFSNTTVSPSNLVDLMTSATFMSLWGTTRWRSSLRRCATSRKVAGSIPDGVIGIFHCHNPSGRTMALELTQPLRETSTRNISWGVKAAGA
jgi:hypothetical protein